MPASLDGALSGLPVKSSSGLSRAAVEDAPPASLPAEEAAASACCARSASCDAGTFKLPSLLGGVAAAAPATFARPLEVAERLAPFEGDPWPGPRLLSGFSD